MPHEDYLFLLVLVVGLYLILQTYWTVTGDAENQLLLGGRMIEATWSAGLSMSAMGETRR